MERGSAGLRRSCMVTGSARKKKTTTKKNQINAPLASKRTLKAHVYYRAHPSSSCRAAMGKDSAVDVFRPHPRLQRCRGNRISSNRGCVWGGGIELMIRLQQISPSADTVKTVPLTTHILQHHSTKHGLSPHLACVLQP